MTASKMSILAVTFVIANIALVIGVAFFAIPARGGVTINPNDIDKQYTVSGKVINVHHRIIVGARVIIHSEQTNDQVPMSTSEKVGPRAVRTDDSGKFVFGVSSGIYTIEVQAGGFKTWKGQVAAKDSSITVTLKSSINNLHMNSELK